MTAGKPNPLNNFLFMKYMDEKGYKEQMIAFLNAVPSQTERDAAARDISTCFQQLRIIFK
jgi:hypothetical protein